jgi:hypothetical protein
MTDQQKYDAITIDANIVLENAFNFEGGMLAQLAQFKDASAEFVLSEVVLREVHKHLLKNTRDARDATLSTVEKARKHGLISTAQSVALAASIGDAKMAADDRIKQFATATGLRIVHARHASSDQVLNAYFKNEAPFASSGKKKEEFPDAFALISMDEWAKAEGKRILAVSKDKGWAEFAESSEQIDVMSELPDALALLQQHAAEAEAYVQRLLALVDEGKAAKLGEIIENGVRDSLDEVLIDVEAESPFHVETDQIDLEFKGLSFARTDKGYDVQVVRTGQDIVVARVGAVIAANADGWFSLSVHDSVDDDYVSMGGANVNVDAEIDEKVLITLRGPIGGDSAEIIVEDVSLSERWATIDFGYIGLDDRDDQNFADIPQLPFDDASENMPQSSSSS